MSQSAQFNEVKLKVCRAAMALRTFQVADIVRLTGLNRSSVQTQLQRLKEDGVLTSMPTTSSGTRGAPPHEYSLVGDAEKRLELARIVSAFDIKDMPTDSPSSARYHEARQLIDQCFSGIATDVENQLSTAEDKISLAAEAEGAAQAPDSIKACLAYEMARIQYLRGGFETAVSMFADLTGRFRAVNDSIMVERITEFRVCLRAHDLLSQPSYQESDPRDRAAALFAAIEDEDFRVTNPLLRQLLDTLEDVASGSDATVPQLQIVQPGAA